MRIPHWVMQVDLITTGYQKKKKKKKKKLILVTFQKTLAHVISMNFSVETNLSNELYMITIPNSNQK